MSCGFETSHQHALLQVQWQIIAKLVLKRANLARKFFRVMLLCHHQVLLVFRGIYIWCPLYFQTCFRPLHCFTLSAYQYIPISAAPWPHPNSIAEVINGSFLFGEPLNRTWGRDIWGLRKSRFNCKSADARTQLNGPMDSAKSQMNAPNANWSYFGWLGFNYKPSFENVSCLQMNHHLFDC